MRISNKTDLTVGASVAEAAAAEAEALQYAVYYFLSSIQNSIYTTNLNTHRRRWCSIDDDGSDDGTRAGGSSRPLVRSALQLEPSANSADLIE